MYESDGFETGSLSIRGSKFTGLIKSIIELDLERVKALIERGANPRATDNCGNTALHVAVLKLRENNYDILEYLLSLDVSVLINDKNHFGETALLLSCSKQKHRAAMMLIEKGADVNICSLRDISPLHFAVQESNIEVAHALIRAGAQIDRPDTSGDTPLHNAIAFNTNQEMVCLLLYYGADTTILNYKNLSPFLMALLFRKCSFADELFDYVCDFNLCDSSGTTTLQYAVHAQYPRVIEMIERGANPVPNLHFFIVQRFYLPPEIMASAWKRYKYKKMWPYPSWYLPLALVLYHDNPLEYFIFIATNSTEEQMLQITDSSGNVNFLRRVVHELYKQGKSHDEVLTFCSILLSYNHKVHETDLDVVYECYGYCELFKLLLFMEFRCSHKPKLNFFPSLVYKFNNDYAEIVYDLFRRRAVGQAMQITDIEEMFDHTADPVVRNIYLRIYAKEGMVAASRVSKYLWAMPNVQKLQELAGIAVKKCLCAKYGITKCSQFYTILKHVDIGETFKKIVSLETPLYSNDSTPYTLKMRTRFRKCRLKQSCQRFDDGDDF